MSYMDILSVVSPGSYLIAKAAETAVKTFTKDSETSTLEKLREDEIRQNIQSRVLQEKARIEQELAIARRIDTANEVEIEEYYDTSGKGALGVRANEEGVTLGLSGEGRRVTKRVYKFKGCRTIEQLVSTAEGHPLFSDKLLENE